MGLNANINPGYRQSIYLNAAESTVAIDNSQCAHIFGHLKTVNPTNTDQSFSEVMRITRKGRVGIMNVDPQEALDVTGNIQCTSMNLTSGLISISPANLSPSPAGIYWRCVNTSPTATAFIQYKDFGANTASGWYFVYNNSPTSMFIRYDGTIVTPNGVVQTSDETEKESTPLSYGLSDILKVSAIKFKWKYQLDLPDDNPLKDNEYYGLCARELHGIFPELVYTESDTYKLNYAELVPVLVNAIKDLKAENDALARRTALLEAAVFNTRSSEST